MIDEKLTILSKRECGLEGLWQKALKVSEKLSVWGVEILSETLGDHLETLVVEKNYICKDFRNLYSNYYSKKFRFSGFYCDRLHFFSNVIEDEFELKVNSTEYQKYYIGYSVIRPVSKRCLGRTVIDPYQIGRSFSEGYFSLRTKFKTNICGANYFVNGFPYSSQDTEVNVCAHTALWSVCRYLSERYPSYKEIYPFDLVLMTGNSNGRTFPYRGMSYTDYSEVLSQFGVFPLIIRFEKSGFYTSEKFKELCAYVESGFPILASLGYHVIILIGHTINYDRKIKYDNDGFGSCTDLIDNFIVIDDNKHPYTQLCSHERRFWNIIECNNEVCADSVKTAVCPLPEKVFLTEKVARLFAKKILLEKKDVLIKQSGGTNWVTRFFLTTCSAYTSFKLKIAVSHQDKISYLVSNLDLPHFVWVMEVSVIDSYKEKLCSAEIVIDGTSGAGDSGQIYLRIGNNIWIDDLYKEFADAPKLFSLFTHNLGGS